MVFSISDCFFLFKKAVKEIKDVLTTNAKKKKKVKEVVV